ncbi:hypothetical protein RSOLAG22IIIB_11601 [Rhizoctonia solani]|uniref:Uncharacterized protein n=1 Tax=Rhizoctonia solani TaxID=456999 RepID=A0A0K6G9D4_9AGAM|nr:hypothetical protein RSOLAG22IIIB_11601 [Rhizoctonia solani]
MSKNPLRSMTHYFIGCTRSIVQFLFDKFLNRSIFDNTKTKAKQDGKQVLRLKADDFEAQRDPEDTCSTSASTPIYTPMRKDYTTFGLNFAEEFLGECYYFVAQVKLPSGSTEFYIFSLSPERKIVSLVDAELSLHHYPIERTVGPIVYFMIGDLSYQWDTQRSTLLTISSDELRAGPSVPRSSSARVQLYSSLEDAKALLDSLSFDVLNATLGKLHYFVAPFESDQGLLGFSVFSLSPDCRTVSFVDANLCCHLHHIDLSFGAIIQFTIGMLQYEWDTQHDTLSIPLPDQLEVDTNDLAPKSSSVQLYVSLEEVKSHVDLLRFDELAIQDIHNLGAFSSASTSSDASSSSRPEVASIPSTSNGAGPSGSLFGSRFFGSSPSKEDVDRWVDQAVKNHQSTGDGTYLTCPESNCGHTARRPHALKVGENMRQMIPPY